MNPSLGVSLVTKAIQSAYALASHHSAGVESHSEDKSVHEDAHGDEIHPADPVFTPQVLTAQGFTAKEPWENQKADCLLVTCSDHRFRDQSIELAHALGFKAPHQVAFPGGIAVSVPLVAADGFLGKATDKIVDMVVSLTHVQDVICVAHADCGAYKVKKVSMIDDAVKQVSGRSIEEIQIDHLERAARRLSMALQGIRLRIFFAKVVPTPEGDRVNFREVQYR